MAPRASMRGQGAPSTRAPVSSSAPPATVPTPVPAQSQPEPEEGPPEPDETPVGVEVLPDGTWLYSLQFDPEPSGLAKDIISRPLVVRIPPKLWARNLREATANCTNDGDLLFHLTCSMVRLPVSIVDRFDARDYKEISNRVNEVLQGNVVGVT